MSHALQQSDGARQLPTSVETPDIDSSTDDYARRFAGAVGDYFLQVQLNGVRRFLSKVDARNVLDVGGGHGQLASPLFELGHEVTVLGSDQSCRQQIDKKQSAEKINFVVGNLLALPFDDNSFDVVLSFRMLPHLAHWQQHIAELCRVARLAVIADYPDTKSFNSLSGSLFKAKHALEGNTRPFTCFRQTQIFNAFDEANFGQLQTHRQFFWPMVVHRALRCVPASKCLETAASLSGLTRRYGSPAIVMAQPTS